jgi:uncharacterized protein YfaS (alpha-2-macroglobulin family)
MGALQASFYTTVFDETGRPVSRLTNTPIYTQSTFFGIKQDWSYYYPLNQPVKFQLAAANKDGRGISATANIQVIKHEYRTVLAKSGSYFRYESQQEDKMMTAQEVAVNGTGSFVYIPKTPGDYEVRIYNSGANSYVSKSFYSYGSWGSTNTSFEVNKEGNINIEIDKKTYKTGEQVVAHFTTPFSGKMLVTMETDHVISYQYVDVSKREASLNLKLNSEHVPNVYITATLIKPHELSDIPLTVAHGFKNVPVEEKNRKIETSIVAQKMFVPKHIKK